MADKKTTGKIDDGVLHKSDKWAAGASRTPSGKVSKGPQGGRTRYVGKRPARAIDPAAEARKTGDPVVAGVVKNVNPKPLDQLLSEREAGRQRELVALLWAELKKSKLKDQPWSAAHVASRARATVDKLSAKLVSFVDGGMPSDRIYQFAETIASAVPLQHACRTPRAALEDKEQRSAAAHEAARTELRETTERLKQAMVDTHAENSNDANAISKWETTFGKLQKIASENPWLLDLMGDTMPQVQEARPVTFETTDAGAITPVYGERPKPRAFEPAVVTEPSKREGLGGFAEPAVVMTDEEADAAGITELAPPIPATDEGAGAGFVTS